MTFDTVITDSHVILPSGMIEKNIIIDDGKIVDFTYLDGLFLTIPAEPAFYEPFRMTIISRHVGRGIFIWIGQDGMLERTPRVSPSVQGPLQISNLWFVCRFILNTSFDRPKNCIRKSNGIRPAD